MTKHTEKGPAITLCRYWVKPDREEQFKKLLHQHWPLFSSLGLVADHPPHLIFRGEDKNRGVFYVETFPWANAEAMSRAHSLPEVAAVWEPMGDCCTEMEFPNVEQIEIEPPSLAERRLSELELVFAALAHEQRRHVLLTLKFRGGEMTAGDIADRFACSWPTTTRHLRVLEQAGLVSVVKRGRERVYKLETQRLLSVVGDWLAWFEAARPG